MATHPLPPTSDLDGDGTSDFLWRHASDRLAIWKMDDLARAESRSLPPLWDRWDFAGTADFDRDGTSDIVWRQEDGRVLIWETKGLGQPIGLSVAHIPMAWIIEGAGDFTGDGKADLLWRHEDGRAAIWEMSGTTVLETKRLPHAGPAWDLAATGDFAGDGSEDFLWRHRDGGVTAWEQSGGEAGAARSFGVVAPQWQIAGTGDFDGDGKDDVLWHHADGRAEIWKMDGAAVAEKDALPRAGSGWQVAQTGDFDGDGQDEIAWQHAGTGRVVIWSFDGDRVSANEVGSMPHDWSLSPERARRHPSAERWRPAEPRAGAGVPASVGAPIAAAPRAKGDLTMAFPATSFATSGAATADFDGDGTSDILWQHKNGSLAIWQMQDFRGGPRLPRQGRPSLAVSGDRGLQRRPDGRLRLAPRRRSSSDLGSERSSAPTAVSLAQVGPAWHIEDTGDYNADGNADLLWRPTTVAR